MQPATITLGCASVALFGFVCIACAVVSLWPKIRCIALAKPSRLNLFVFVASMAVATYAAQKPKLVYRTSFDSVEEVETPTVGPAGTCKEGAAFVEGYSGKALYVPASTSPAYVFLENGLPVGAGCIEFWAKLSGKKDSYADKGDPIFFCLTKSTDHSNGSFGSLEFNANDGSGKGGILGALPFFHFAPESWEYSKPYSKYLGVSGVGSWHHYALVWNMNGIGTIAGNPNVAVLIDGVVKSSAMKSSSWNEDTFLARMTQSMYLNFGRATQGYSKEPFSIDEFRIWDSDVTTILPLPDTPYYDVRYVYDGEAHTLGDPAFDLSGYDMSYSLSEDGVYLSDLPALTDAGEICIWYVGTNGSDRIAGSANVTVVPRKVTFASASAEKPYDGAPLTAQSVTTNGSVVAGEAFEFSFAGSITDIGSVENAFTWSPAVGTKSANYEVKSVFGTLTVTSGAGYNGIEYEVVGEHVVITNVAVSDDGAVDIPATIGGLPVSRISLGASAKSAVKSISTPSRVVSASSGVQSYLFAFAGCWNLERLVFKDAPPDEGLSPTALQMADSICYPAESAARWRKILRNIGYGGQYGSYEGEWDGSNEIASDVPQVETTSYVYSTVTNEIHHYATTTNVVLTYATVTNLVKYVPEPGTSPDAGYGVKAGEAAEFAIAGAAGWDAFGVPAGMEWNKATGMLGGQAKVSGSYDVMFVSGSGADTKIMRTTIAVEPFEKIVGYVGVAFSRGGSPLDALKSYSALPAGLKWAAGVLQGVPTKAQTLALETVDGEPVTIEIKPLPDEIAATFDGCVYLPPSSPAGDVLRTCDIGGTATFSAATSGRLSASVKTAAKTYSFSAPSWESAEAGEVFVLKGRATVKTGETLEVEARAAEGRSVVTIRLSGGEFGAEGILAVLERDVYAKNGAKWVDEVSHALMAKCKGTYQFGFDAVGELPEMGGTVASAAAWTFRPVAKVEASFLKVVLKDTGVASITGTLPDKTKVSVSAKARAEANGEKVVFRIVSAAFSGKTTTLPIEVVLGSDGAIVDGRLDCGEIYSVKRD